MVVARRRFARPVPGALALAARGGRFIAPRAILPVARFHRDPRAFVPAPLHTHFHRPTPHAAVVNTFAETPRASRTGPLAVVLLAQAAALVSLLPWGLVAGFSFLSFSAGAGEPPLLPAPLLFAFWGYPLLAASCAALTWRAWRRGDARAAVRWSGVELLAAAVVLGFAGFAFSPVG